MKKLAFTLAEVLITLAIIGVVAALTIPAVVKNYQKTQTITKLKKVYSILNQAYNTSQAENGFENTWDNYPNITMADYFDRYWKPYLKISKICNTYQECNYDNRRPWFEPRGDRDAWDVVSPQHRVTFVMSDGTLIVLIVTHTNGTTLAPYIIVDLNNWQKPNRLGRDVFWFIRTNKGILPYGYEMSANTIKSNCSNAGDGHCCAAFIAKNGWEIKDDYPW